MDWSLWRRWTATVTTGEFVGFAVPVSAGVLGSAANVAPWPGFALMLAAGAVEGSLLGWAQAWALRGRLPGLSRRAFTAATAAAAVLAYALGMLPSTLGDRLTRLPTGLLVAAGVAAGLVLLCSIGGAQWLVLRRSGVHAPWWIATTAGAWAAALGVFLAVATPLWHEGQPLPATLAIGVFAGALMAATAAALTGFAAHRLVPTPPPASRDLGRGNVG